MNIQDKGSPELQKSEVLSICPSQSEQAIEKVTTACSTSIFSSLSDSFSYFANQISAKVLYPTSDSAKWEERRKEMEQTLGGVRVQVPFLDEQTLDGMFFPSNKEGPLSQKAIIFAPGADGYYEDNFSAYFVSLVKQKLGDVNIIILNYPTVMANKEKGSLNPDSMASTVFSAFQYLVKAQGLQPNDIITYGQSLGGVASVRGARHAQRLYPDAKIKLVNERSFLNLPDVVYQLFGPIGGVMKSMTEWASWTTTDVLESWEEIKGEKFVIFSEYDGVVLKVKSLYEAIHQKDDPRVKVLSLEGNQVATLEHWRTFTVNEEKAIIQQMRGMFGLASEETEIIDLASASKEYVSVPVTGSPKI